MWLAGSVDRAESQHREIEVETGERALGSVFRVEIRGTNERRLDTRRKMNEPLGFRSFCLQPNENTGVAVDPFKGAFGWGFVNDPDRVDDDVAVFEMGAPCRGIENVGGDPFDLVVPSFVFVGTAASGDACDAESLIYRSFADLSTDKAAAAGNEEIHTQWRERSRIMFLRAPKVTLVPTVGMETTVLVIGGGATGAGVARDLSMRGVGVTLVERGGFAGGTSGRSHGLLHSGARYVPGDFEGARECIAENWVMKEIAPHCISDTGGLFVQVAGDDPDYFEEKREKCEDLGIETEVLTGADARKEVSDLTPDVERALRVPDAVIHPTQLTAANAADARERGTTLLPETEVTDLIVEKGRIRGAVVDDDSGEREIHADHVVNATGAWAGNLGKMAGIELEMAPSSGVMVAVEFGGLDTVLNRARPAADGDIIIPHDEQVVLGTTSVDVEDPDEFERDDGEIDRMFEECGAMLSGLDPDQIDRVYWGVRPLYNEDRKQYAGRGISRGFYLLDHAERDDLDGFTSIVGGKLTTYREMAEAVSDHVCERLEIEREGEGETADVPLFGYDTPEKVDEFIREFAIDNPADSDVIGGR